MTNTNPTTHPSTNLLNPADFVATNVTGFYYASEDGVGANAFGGRFAAVMTVGDMLFAADYNGNGHPESWRTKKTTTVCARHMQPQQVVRLYKDPQEAFEASRCN